MLRALLWFDFRTGSQRTSCGSTTALRRTPNTRWTHLSIQGTRDLFQPYTTIHSASLGGSKTHYLHSPTPCTLGLAFKFSESLSSLSSPQGELLPLEQHGSATALHSQFLSSDCWWLHLTARNYPSLENRCQRLGSGNWIIEDGKPYVCVH